MSPRTQRYFNWLNYTQWMVLNGRPCGSETEKGDSAWSLLRSADTELFELVELYIGDGLEMAGSLVDTGEETIWTLFRSPETALFK